jgi:hypothetical protein
MSLKATENKTAIKILFRDILIEDQRKKKKRQQTLLRIMMICADYFN